MPGRGRGRPPHPYVLTPAEQRVLDELRRGGTNAEIAVRLGLSPDTVKSHISSMLSKLGLDDRHALAAWQPQGARRRLLGLLALPPALASAGRPFLWVGTGAVGLAGAAAVAVAVVLVAGNGESPPIAIPTTPSPTATAPAPPPTAAPTESPSPSRTPEQAPTSTPSPTPSPAPATATPTIAPSDPDTTAFGYDIYDTTGAVASAGSYTFLSDPDDTTTAVTTYEGLRDGLATALLIHTADADGVSRAVLYDAVKVRDLFEWHVADDCFVRYTVTDVKAKPPRTTLRKEFGVEWMTYAFTGCNGAIAAEVPATLRWGNLPDLGGAALLAPVIHGIYQIVPSGWRGETVDLVLDFSGPGQPPEYRSYSTLAEARLLPYWRDPALPEGWILDNARIGFEGPRNGYCATFLTEERTWRDNEVYRNTAFDLCALSTTGWYEPREAFDRNSVTETRVVAGRPAVVNYGRSSDEGYPIGIEVYDPETESEYEFRAHDSSIGGSNPEPALAIVRGLFDEQPPTPGE